MVTLVGEFEAKFEFIGNRGPVLWFVTETRAGHGAGKPSEMRIEESADMFAFLGQGLRNARLAADFSPREPGRRGWGADNPCPRQRPVPMPPTLGLRPGLQMESGW